MSRIGKLPVAIPANVEVTVDGQLVKVLGPKGALEHRVAEPIKVTRGENGELQVSRPDDERVSKSLHGLTRTLVANMVTGVTPVMRRSLRSSASATACSRGVRPNLSSRSDTATRSR